MSDILFPTATTWVTPATWDIILIADVSDSNNPKDCTLAELPISTATQNALNAKQGWITLTTTWTSWPATLISDTLNIPQYTGWGGWLQLPTYTVGAAGADYTTIQWALDAATTGGLIYVMDWTYVITSWLKFKANYQYIIGNWEKCIIQFNGATVTTAISPNATNLKQCGISWVSIQQTNGTVQGAALDLSDMSLMSVDVEIKDAGVAVKMNDANNNTFYNRVNIRAFWCARGIELNGTNPSNNNYFSGRIANKSGGDYGVYIVKGQWNSFKDLSIEPVATTGNTGIYITSANAYANTFENIWVEGNANGVTIDSTVTYNSFIGGTVTANTTNRTDNGKNTVWFNTQVGSVALTVLQPFIATDTGNASSTVSTIQNNTSFAHTGGKLVAIELLNWSDSSKVLELKNSWTWKTLSIMQWTSEVASIAPWWDLMTLSTIDVWHESDTTLSRVSAGVIAVEGVTVPTISSTDTLTNKRNQPRVVSATSYTTDTGTSLDVSTCDIFIVTAQAGALLFNAPSGTPVQWEKLIIRIKDNWTSRTLTYNAIYRAIGVTLPTATTISKTTYIWLVYNSTDTKWDCIAVSTEA